MCVQSFSVLVLVFALCRSIHNDCGLYLIAFCRFWADKKKTNSRFHFYDYVASLNAIEEAAYEWIILHQDSWTRVQLLRIEMHLNFKMWPNLLSTSIFMK